MQYCDYIRQSQARLEREQQLANAYNKKPASLKVKNLWMHSVEKHTPYQGINAVNIIGVIAGLLVAGTIIVLSVIL